MATTFKEIYDRAIFRFADYEFLKHDIQTREDILERHLMAAKTDFQRICKFDISEYDKELKRFNVDLGDEEIEILSLGVASKWLSYKSLDSELLRNVLNSRDYYYYSPANLLKEIQTLRKTLKDEFQSAMRRYSYYDNSLDTLKV